MNLDGLRVAAERALRRTPSKEREEVIYALSGKLDIVSRRRYVRLSRVTVDQYLAPDDDIEVHRSVLPAPEAEWDFRGRLVPAHPSPWAEWTVLSVDRIGPDCVRLIVPRVGSMPVPVGDFVDAVLKGKVREPRAHDSSA